MQQMVVHLGGFDRSRRLRARPFTPRACKEADLFADGHDDRAVSIHLKDVRMECGRQPHRMPGQCETGCR